MIIETSCNQLFYVVETNDPSLAHVWYGLQVKRAKGTFLKVAKARLTLVRKEASKVVASKAPEHLLGKII
jgi:hypothetical protein